MTFGLSLAAQATQLRNAAENPLTSSDVSPGFFSGSLSAPFSGLARGIIAKPGLLAGEALTPVLRPIARSVDQIFGTDTVGFLEAERRKNVEFLKELTPDGATTGRAGQMLHGLFDILPTAIAGGPGGAAILEGFAAKKLIEDKGVDSVTANVYGLIQGVTTGVGVGLPLSIGLRAAPDFAYAAAANIFPNMAARGASHLVLKEAGYNDMAEQYQALDAAAILADGTLGIFFAGAGRVLKGIDAKRQAEIRAKTMPSDIDAALTAKAAHHLEIDAAPGIPRDPGSRDAHVQSVLKAAEDMIAGRPVDVGTMVDEAGFEKNPARVQLQKEIGELGKAYDTVLEEPIGPANDPLVTLKPEEIGDVIVERGPVWKKGEAELKFKAFGLVKIIWKHGEKSTRTSPENQVTRADILRFPEVMRDYAPIFDETQADGKRKVEWQVEREDGKRVLYAVSRFTNADGQHHLVTVFVNDGSNQRIAAKPTSEKTNRPAESPDVASTALGGDTGPGSFAVEHPSGQKGGSAATVARPGEDLKAAGADLPEVRAAQELVRTSPDLMVAREDGTTVKASELFSEVEQLVGQAETDARAFEAAVSCILRGG